MNPRAAACAALAAWVASGAGTGPFPRAAPAAAAQRYATAAPAITPVAMSASCRPEAAADVDLGAAWLLVRAPEIARGAFDRAVDADPDCALGYWGQAVARFDAAADGTAAAVAAIEATIARAASVPAQTAFERAAVAALVRLRAREAAPGIAAAWPARFAAYRDALCADTTPDRAIRLWCARALADSWTAGITASASIVAPGITPDATLRRAALERIADLSREAPLDVGAAVIVLEVAPDPGAPIVGRAIAAIAAGNPPAPAPHALAARIALRRGEWAAAVSAAERARGAGPDDPRAADALHVQIEALLQRGRRAEGYALAYRTLKGGRATDGSTAGARLFARVVLGDRRLDGRGLGDRTALPIDEPSAALWPVVFVAGLDAALRAWPGGDATLLGRARAATAALEAMAPGTRASEIAWARTLIDAAIAASQDEYPEAVLQVEHAIELERALAVADPELVPLMSARELAAELWLRTYRYEDARREARAVLEAQPQRLGPLVVIARASARLEDAAAATEAWRRVRDLRADADADDPIRVEAQRALAGSP
jgi:hypothetical protein